MRRKTIALITLTVIVLVVVSYFAVAQLDAIINRGGKYDKSIVKNVSTPEEEQALFAAENANYTNIFQMERFDGSSDPDSYLHPGLYLEYTYANFIDSEVLHYYGTRFESLKGKTKLTEYNYEANVHTWSNIRFSTGPMVDNASRYNDTITISSPNGTVLFRNADYTGASWGMKFAYRNGTTYQMLDAGGIDLDFADCYVVEMNLKYSETYAPLAAFFSDVYQIVIVDKNFVPVFLCVQSENIVA